MITHISTCKFTPSEIRDAIILASIIHVERNTYPFPTFIRYHLDELEKWLDKNE